MLIQAVALNLRLLMRKRYGIGAPRVLRGLAALHPPAGGPPQVERELQLPLVIASVF